MEDISFNDSGKRVYITIDNQRKEIPICEIKKFTTFITLNQSMNTSLKEDIVIDASLNYLPYNAQEEDLSYTDNSDIDVEYSSSTEDIEENGITTVNTWYTGPEFYILNDKAKQTDLDGVVTITIYNGEEIYYQKDVSFKKGSITDNIPNKLPIGEYSATIAFAGNKYLEQTILNIDFSVEKRLAFFTFDKEKYYGDPNDNIVIAGTLKDSLTKKIIKGCPVKIDFNSVTYTTTTDGLGIAYISVDIPDADITHCSSQPDNEVEISNNEAGDEYRNDPEEHYDFDDDGNIIEIEEDEDIESPLVEDDPKQVKNEDETVFDIKKENDVDDTFDYGYPNASYPVTIYLDSESYRNDNTTVYVIANKIQTSTEVNQTSDVVDNIVTLSGKVKAHYKDKDTYAIYGNTVVSFDDTDYISNKININTHGEFSIQIDFDEVNLSTNTSDIEDLIPYKKQLYQNTVTDIKAEEKVTLGKIMTATATVQSVNSNLSVKDGMVVFILKTNNKEVYRYGSQIDSIGRAVFFFNTSKKGSYTIEAHYYGLFGYGESSSEIKTIEVV